MSRGGAGAASPAQPRAQGGLGGLGEGAVSSLRGAMGQGAGYTPADSLGHFRLPTDSDTTDSGQVLGQGACDLQQCVDYDELEYDPSERRPGGPVAEAIWAAGPQARRRKWALPLLACAAALLVQSAGLHAATKHHVLWMERLGQRADGSGTVPAELLAPRDRLVAWLGSDDASKLPVDILAGSLPLVWLAVVLGQRNLRLWTHTLLAGTILALLKGLCAWVTIVPDPTGGESCLERLHPQVLSHFQRQAGVLESIPLVLWLWAQDMLFGMRNQQSLVCAGSFSGPSYACALFSLGLYDASRIRVRKLKPHFRTLYHAAAALLLSSIALLDAGLDLAVRRQSTLDVALALVLALLLYGSPVVAMSADRFLLEGCAVEPDAKVGCDVGDVVVPPCCVPFCLLHGRYFLHTWPAQQVREALRAQAEAKRASEEFRIEQQEAARQSLELEAQLDAVRSRSQARRRQDEAEAERRYAEQVAEAQAASERRLAAELGKMEMEAAEERKKRAELEENAEREERELEEFKARTEEDCRRLQEALEAAKKEAEEAQAALQEAKEKALSQALEVAQLRQAAAERGDVGVLEEVDKQVYEAPEALKAADAEEAAAAAEEAAVAALLEPPEPVKEKGLQDEEMAAADSPEEPLKLEEAAPASDELPAEKPVEAAAEEEKAEDPAEEVPAASQEELADAKPPPPTVSEACGSVVSAATTELPLESLVSTAVESAVSAAGTQEVGERAVEVAAVEALPEPAVGEPAAASSSPAEILVAAAPEEAAPAVVEALPAVVEVEPAVVEVVPAEVEEVPAAAEVVPEVVEASPEVVEAAPEVAEAAPDAVEAAPEVVEAAPEVIETASVEAAPEVAGTAPEVVGAAPEVETARVPMPNGEVAAMPNGEVAAVPNGEDAAATAEPSSQEGDQGHPAAPPAESG